MYNDVMYGQFVGLPDFVERIYCTPEFERMKRISQDSLPYWLVPWKVPSRMNHCMGVLWLARLMLEYNNFDARTVNLLLASALLHDVGNAALSHLSEPFLRKLTGMDGESFLSKRLAGTQTETILNSEGFTIQEVVGFVTGNAKPLSVVLHGSMDIDNIDNVGRYWFFASNGERLFDAELIAQSFRFHQGEWYLTYDCIQEVRKWQKARQVVYALIYGAPHLNIVMMVWRALYLAFRKDELKDYFFHCSDNEAIDYLLQCNGGSAKLIKKVIGQDRFTEAFCVETTQPSQKLISMANDDFWRGWLADEICSSFNLPAWAVCAHISKGRDKRKVELLFISQNGARHFDQKNCDPPYRIKVYVDREFEGILPKIQNFVRGLI